MGSRNPLARVFNDRFADNLYAKRAELKWSRRELAERSGLHTRTIEMIENNRTHPASRHRRPATLGEAILLAEALGTTAGDLIRGDRAAGGERHA